VRLDDPQDLSLRSPTLQARGMKVPADLYARYRACIWASRNSPIPSTIRPSC
jgi:hypothetical protein